MIARFIKYAKFLAVIVAVGGFIFVGVNATEAGKVSAIKKRVRTSVFLPAGSSANTSSSVSSVRSSIFPNPIETIITAGPENNSFVQGTKVTFILDGWQVLPFKKLTQFEVYLAGVDADWHQASNNISYTLPVGNRTYSFMARAVDAAGNRDVTPAIRTFTIYTSPYFGQFDISGINYQGSYNKPQYEKFTIYARNIQLPVNITGWRVTVKRGGFSFVIPSAERIYDPRNPMNADPVVLNPNGSLDVFVGKVSPLGVNFQENSCESYLANTFEGYDSLSNYGSCQLPDPGSFGDYSVECRTFLKSIGSCSPVNLTYYQFAPEPECRDFIVRNYNYQSCVSRNKNLAQFFSGRWRIYLNRNSEILDDLNDTIYLHDNKGLLVAAVGY